MSQSNECASCAIAEGSGSEAGAGLLQSGGVGEGPWEDRMSLWFNQQRRDRKGTQLSTRLGLWKGWSGPRPVLPPGVQWTPLQGGSHTPRPRQCDEWGWRTG